MTMDLANFYLRTPLDHPEYIQIQISVIQQEPIDKYDLMRFAHKGGYTSKSANAHTDSSNQENLPTIYCVNRPRHMDTTNARPHLVFGDTNGGQTPLCSSWMILELNTLESDMPNTF